jgi:hypothetical protein
VQGRAPGRGGAHDAIICVPASGGAEAQRGSAAGSAEVG